MSAVGSVPRRPPAVGVSTGPPALVGAISRIRRYDYLLVTPAPLTPPPPIRRRRTLSKQAAAASPDDRPWPVSRFNQFSSEFRQSSARRWPPCQQQPDGRLLKTEAGRRRRVAALRAPPSRPGSIISSGRLAYRPGPHALVRTGLRRIRASLPPIECPLFAQQPLLALFARAEPPHGR